MTDDGGPDFLTVDYVAFTRDVPIPSPAAPPPAHGR